MEDLTIYYTVLKKILRKNRMKICENVLKFCDLISSPRRFLIYNLFALYVHINFHSNQKWLNFSRVKTNIWTIITIHGKNYTFTSNAAMQNLLRKRKFQYRYFFNLQNWILFLLLYILSYFQKLQQWFITALFIHPLKITIEQLKKKITHP